MKKTIMFIAVIAIIAVLAVSVVLILRASNTGMAVYSSPGGSVSQNSQSNQPTQQVVVMTSNTNLGNIMVGANGMTLYIFRADTNGESTCYGACTNYWPPLLTSDNVQPMGQGITAILGVTERTDGTFQVTANGMPLYYFNGDHAPGDTNGQGNTGSGASWYVLSPSGTQITTPLAGSTTAPASSSSSSSSNMNSNPSSTTSSGSSGSSGGYSY